jgi:hypothetical protein
VFVYTYICVGKDILFTLDIVPFLIEMRYRLKQIKLGL